METTTETARPAAAPSHAPHASCTEDVLLWHALYQLEASYWREVDVNGGGNAHTYYVPDGVMVAGHNRFCGSGEIRRFYEWRQRQASMAVSGAMVTRHLINNLHVVACGDRAAKVFGVISLYASARRAPAPQSKPPILMADLFNECVKDDDDRWLYRSHTLQPVFLSHESPLSMAFHMAR